MPVYEFKCSECPSHRDVLIDHRSLKGLELLCVQCGGVMTASNVQKFGIVLSNTETNQAPMQNQKIKACGHSHACLCAVKVRKPNPFTRQINKVHDDESADLRHISPVRNP